jgi:hypothetical protein
VKDKRLPNTGPPQQTFRYQNVFTVLKNRTDLRETTAGNIRRQFIVESFAIAVTQNTVHEHRLIVQLVLRMHAYKRICRTVHRNR